MQASDFAKVNRTTRLVFFGSMILLAAFFIYRRIAAPHVTYLFAMQRYNAAMDKILDKSQMTEDMLKASDKKLKELSAQFSQVRNILHTQSEAEEFFSDLQAISVETECPVYSLTFIGDEPSAELKQVEHTLGVTAKKAVLSVAGMYQNVVLLIERLQNRSRKVWVEGVNMELINDTLAQVKCDIVLKIYVIQNKEASRHE